ncbi:hypothetical protein FACS1894170_10700 [Planctomycetales bacterium]|nr:hypothetical protein FACS1894170_10700 [Planctomycetales bacterium]
MASMGLPRLKGGKWVRYTKEYFGKTSYANLGKSEFFETKKLVIRRTGSYVLSCIDENGYYFSNNVFVCLPKIGNYELRFFLGILNSTLLTWYYQNVHPQIGSLFPEIKINLINEFPVPRLDLSQKSDKAAHDKLISLVDTMLDLKKREKEAMLRTKTIIERQIASTDEPRFWFIALGAILIVVGFTLKGRELYKKWHSDDDETIKKE